MVVSWRSKRSVGHDASTSRIETSLVRVSYKIL
jgi:hypothetical protein